MPDHPVGTPAPTGIDACEWLADEALVQRIFQRVSPHLPERLPATAHGSALGRIHYYIYNPQPACPLPFLPPYRLPPSRCRYRYRYLCGYRLPLPIYPFTLYSFAVFFTLLAFHPFTLLPSNPFYPFTPLPFYSFIHLPIYPFPLFILLSFFFTLLAFQHFTLLPFNHLPLYPFTLLPIYPFSL